MAKAGDKTGFDRIASQGCDNGYIRASLFGRARGKVATRCRDKIDVAGDQIGGKFRQPSIVSLCPAVFDCQILPFDIPRFSQALIEGSKIRSRGCGRCAAEPADHRHRSLLCARGWWTEYRQPAENSEQ